MKFTITTTVLLLCFFIKISYSQKTTRGPLIKEYGNVFKVADQDLKINTEATYNVVFDIGRTFDKKDKTNPLIETAARFLNMHAQNGVKKSNMNVALVIHGSAAYDILNDANYREKYGIDNPNTKLVAALKDAGVAIVICGQTAASKKITRAKVLPQVDFALSAMTALIHYQNKQYRLINF